MGCDSNPEDEPDTLSMLPLTSGQKVLALGHYTPETADFRMKLKVYDTAGTDLTASWNEPLVQKTTYAENHGMGVDSNGNVYIATQTYGDNGYDWFVNKYLTNGESDAARWEKYFDGGYALNDMPEALVVDHADNIYVVGYFQKSQDDTDVRIKKFSADGTEDTVNWNKVLSGGSSTIDKAYTATVDGSNNLYVAMMVGNVFSVKKFSPTGTDITPAWSPAAPIAADAMVVDSSDNLYVASTSNNVWRYNSSGTRTGISDTNVDMYVSDMVLDGTSAFYVVGTKSGPAGRIKKYDASTMAEITASWDKTISGAGGYESINAAAVDTSHNLYVMGYYDGGGGVLRLDWRIKKFDVSGREDTNWDKTFDSNSGQSDMGQSLLVVTLP